jgi:hypothetical protein
MFRKERQMAEIATKPKSGAKAPATHYLDIPGTRIATAVDRTSQLSDGILKSLDTGERTAVAAIGQFVVTVEEALPQEVSGTSDVAMKITEAGMEMADRLIHTQYEVLRHVIDAAAKSLSSRNGAKPTAAP